MAVAAGIVVLFGFTAMGAYLPVPSHVFGSAFLNAINYTKMIAVNTIFLLICWQELIEHISYA